MFWHIFDTFCTSTEHNLTELHYPCSERTMHVYLMAYFNTLPIYFNKRKYSCWLVVGFGHSYNLQDSFDLNTAWYS